MSTARGPCQRNCPAFRDWTIEHFHAQDRPGVVVFHSPERPGVMATMHEAWGTDAFGETTVFPSSSEAVQFAKRMYNATVSLGPE